MTTTDLIDAIHTQLEDLTPPEALAILKVVTADLRAEIDLAGMDLLKKVRAEDRLIARVNMPGRGN